MSSNLTNKYNPQEHFYHFLPCENSSNLTNKYNPQEQKSGNEYTVLGSNLTNKYNPQELVGTGSVVGKVQILPINTILKNAVYSVFSSYVFKSYQ